MSASDDADAEKAKFRDAEGGEGAFDERLRSDSIHTRRRTQPSGALNRARARGPCEGSSRGSLSHCSRNARCCRRRKAPRQSLEVRGETAESGQARSKIVTAAAK